MSLLVTTLIASIISLMTAWAFEVIKMWLNRAKLSVISCEYHDDGKEFFYYFTVRNLGRTTARACASQLTIHLKDWDKITDEGIFNSKSVMSHGSAGLNNLNTFWERSGKPLEINVHPGQTQRINICSAHRSEGKEWIFVIPSEAGYKVPQIKFGGRGFELLLRVGSDNAKPITQFGQVLNAGKHNHPTMEMSMGPTPAFSWKPQKQSILKRVLRLK